MCVGGGGCRGRERVEMDLCCVLLELNERQGFTFLTAIFCFLTQYHIPIVSIETNTSLTYAAHTV